MVEAGHGVGDPITVKDGADRDRLRRGILFLAVVDNDVHIGGGGVGVGSSLGTHDVCEQEVGAQE